MYEPGYFLQNPHINMRVRPVSPLLAILIFVLIAPEALAQHVANPFAGATQYVNPEYAAEVNAVARQTTDVTLANQMRVVATYPTALWLDHMGTIAGDAGRLRLAQHIQQALMQQKGAAPVGLPLVIY